MKASIYLIGGWQEPLWYDASSFPFIVPGSIVKVPFRRQVQWGVVTKVSSSCPVALHKVRSVIEVIDLGDPSFFLFIERMCRLFFLSPGEMYQTALHALLGKKMGTIADPYHFQLCSLTAEQKEAVEKISPFILSPSYAPFLIHGVTGSGKTEVYAHLMSQALIQKKTVFCLAPEIGLASMLARRLKIRLGSGSVFSYHASSSKEERALCLHALEAQHPCVIVGVHLPPLLPCKNLGLIVVDEEHDSGFEDQHTSHFSSKQAALCRAQVYRLPIILGSATPSPFSWHQAKTGTWKLIELSKRQSSVAPPVIEKVVLDSKEKRSCFWISKQLETAINEVLLRQEQVILFINRRGIRLCAQCSQCGYVFSCSECAVSMTVHEENEHTFFVCHYCGREKEMEKACPSCKGEKLITKGIGTQFLLRHLMRLFPQARVARADTDLRRKGERVENVLERFEKREIDILVGTQTVTKGHHFPYVTLVGIVWADSELSFPHYTAHARALARLLQVAGRAGRAEKKGRVILQMVKEHPVFKFLDEKDYPAFAHQELEIRKVVNYPPFCRLLTIQISHSDEEKVEAEAELLAQKLKKAISELQGWVQIQGPAKPLIEKVRGCHLRQLCIKTTSYLAVASKTFVVLSKESWQAKVSVTVATE